MAYGGLRGAIAFSLAIMLDRETIGHAEYFITATLFVILFTVFIMVLFNFFPLITIDCPI